MRFLRNICVGDPRNVIVLKQPLTIKCINLLLQDWWFVHTILGLTTGYGSWVSCGNNKKGIATDRYEQAARIKAIPKVANCVFDLDMPFTGNSRVCAFWHQKVRCQLTPLTDHYLFTMRHIGKLCLSLEWDIKNGTPGKAFSWSNLQDKRATIECIQ